MFTLTRGRRLKNDYQTIDKCIKEGVGDDVNLVQSFERSFFAAKI